MTDFEYDPYAKMVTVEVSFAEENLKRVELLSKEVAIPVEKLLSSALALGLYFLVRQYEAQGFWIPQ